MNLLRQSPIIWRLTSNEESEGKVEKDRTRRLMTVVDVEEATSAGDFFAFLFELVVTAFNEGFALVSFNIPVVASKLLQDSNIQFKETPISWD